jgi:hypothetical protein
MPERLDGYARRDNVSRALGAAASWLPQPDIVSPHNPWGMQLRSSIPHDDTPVMKAG